jgi:ribosomal protein S18 acetylase RimI-like enzyme
MALPPFVQPFWAAMDALFSQVHPTAWGAVITDGRFPRVWDANYARLDRPEPVSVAEVEADLLPRLAASGAETMHVVTFHHEAHVRLLAELSTRGHRLVWDLVLVRGAEPEPNDREPPPVEEVPAGPELWTAVEGTLSLFGADPDEAIDQLRRIETDVMDPGGKRWFGVRDEDGVLAALAAVLVLDDVGYVDNVATLPHARRRGYAGALTDRAAREALAGGARHVFLLADPDDPPVVGLYRRLGFREAGRLASTRGPLP